MELSVQKRAVFGKKLPSLRKEGLVPGVIYGKYLKEGINLSFDKNTFLKIYKQTGMSTPITLTGDGINEFVLVQDYSVHPVTSVLMHVDFKAIKKDEKVSAFVQIVLEGKSIAEKDNIGRVQLVQDEIEVEALPQNLPRQIVIDVTNLAQIHDTITIKDLKLDKNVTVKGDEDKVIVSVVEIKESKESDTPTPAAATTESK